MLYIPSYYWSFQCPPSILSPSRRWDVWFTNNDFYFLVRHVNNCCIWKIRDQLTINSWGIWELFNQLKWELIFDSHFQSQISASTKPNIINSSKTKKIKLNVNIQSNLDTRMKWLLNKNPKENLLKILKMNMRKRNW